MELTYEEVARILALVDTAQGEDLTFSLGGRRVTLTSWKPQPVRPMRTEPAAAARQPAGLVDVRSFELGYFRRLQELGVGTCVREGDVLGEIVGLPAAPAKAVRAPVDGRIVDLCVDEDSFVEYGQVLLMLEVAVAASADAAPPEEAVAAPTRTG